MAAQYVLLIVLTVTIYRKPTKSEMLGEAVYLYIYTLLILSLLCEKIFTDEETEVNATSKCWSTGSA